MYCLELIEFDVSNTSYYVEVENGELLRDIVWSWKMILGGHGKFLGKNMGTLYVLTLHSSSLHAIPFSCLSSWSDGVKEDAKCPNNLHKNQGVKVNVDLYSASS